MIIDVACGPEHTVAMTPDGRVFTWGFGGYGRLGHNTNENEMVPRLLMHMKPSNVHTGGACAIFAGGSSCFVESRTQKQMFFWGQLKASGEATMYPKRYEDISSVAPEVFDVGMKHVLVSDGTNTFSMVCAPPPTPSVVGSHIARPLSPTPTRVSPSSFFRVLAFALASQNRGFWLTGFSPLSRSISDHATSGHPHLVDNLAIQGASPCYGELGYGESIAGRSSTIFQPAGPLNGIPIIGIACGIVRTQRIPTSPASPPLVADDEPPPLPPSAARLPWQVVPLAHATLPISPFHFCIVSRFVPPKNH